MKSVHALAAALTAGLAVLAAAAVPASPARAAEATACEPAGKVRYLCGPVNAEDMVLAPGTDWMVVSGMAGEAGQGGRLYLVDARRKTWKVMVPDVSGPAKAPYAACPSAPDMVRFAAHGLALRPGRNGRHTLYAINHGGRESVEVFELQAAGAEPSLRWAGCLIVPEGVSPNSVATTPEGGLVVTKFNQAGDAGAFQKMAAGEKTGALYEWTAAGGFRQVPGSELSGNNGVAVSADGKWVFVNAWPEGRVVRYARGSDAPPVSAAVDFLPDNLRWAPDGQLLVAGQAGLFKALLACGRPQCPHAWSVVKLDPKTMKITPVLHETGTLAFSDATGALQVGKEVWVGTYRGDRLAYAPLR